MEISSKNNENVKYIKKVLSSSKTRKKDEVFAIEGINLCEEAFKNKIEIIKIFYTLKCYEKFRTLIDRITMETNAKVYVVANEIMSNMCDTDSPQGILALCKSIDKKVKEDKIDLYSKIVLLENIQNPSNLGSVLRSVSAFGIDLVVLSGASCDIYNPKVLRGSMGAVFRVNILCVENTVNFITHLKKEKFMTFASVLDKNVEDVTLLNDFQKIAIVMGNEGNGITKEVIQVCDRKISIPMKANCESLNVSVATGIILWEMTRNERKIR